MDRLSSEGKQAIKDVIKHREREIKKADEKISFYNAELTKHTQIKSKLEQEINALKEDLKS